MKRIAATLIVLLSASVGRGADKPNVLFIAIDDLNDWIGCLQGHPQAQTPHMDRLAARGTLFTNAHCQSPLCNPSRSSLLTGLRPSTTGIYGLSPGIRRVDATRQVVSLPQHFHQSGYFTFSAGKIFHDGSIRYGGAPAGKGKGGKKAAATPGPDEPLEFERFGERAGMPKPATPFVQSPQKHPAMDWGVFPDDDREQADWKIADSALEAMKNAPADRPFFIAAGFRLPHVPCYASRKWFDLYPLDTLKLPPVKKDDRDDTPPFSWYLHWSLPEPRLQWLEESNTWVSLVRSYLASTSFMDSQVGRLLDGLDATGKAGQTIVVLWSDHGWHLGEKLITGKNTLWDRSTRVPLIFAGPGITPGQRCARPAELLDIYPTLVELAGLPPRPGLEGLSLAPQLRDAQAPRDRPAITTHGQNNHGVRSERWRYIRYADGSQELYDMVNDPNEWTNLAGDPKHAPVIADHARWLPRVNLKSAQLDAARVLEMHEGRWHWEGKPIDSIPMSR
jgi:arylsulfatase A-like enzyme